MSICGNPKTNKPNEIAGMGELCITAAIKAGARVGRKQTMQGNIDSVETQLTDG